MARSAPLALLLWIVLTSSPLAAAQNWPQWRGPHRDGKSADRGLLQAWPEGGPPLAWTAEGLGRGFSTVSLSEDRLFTLGDWGERQYVLALARNDGSVLWRTDIGPSWSDRGLYPGSRSTPTLDGERLYALGTEGDLVCLVVENGEIAWGPVRNEGRNSAAISYADGRLYFRYQDGLVVLVEATPEAYREHGSFRLPDVEEPSWPHPVIAGGWLYLREQDRLYAYDVRAGGPDTPARP